MKHILRFVVGLLSLAAVVVSAPIIIVGFVVYAIWSVGRDVLNSWR